MMDTNLDLLQCLLKILVNKNTSGSSFDSEIMSNQELSEDLHKPNIRTFENGKVLLSFTKNVFVADLADMQLICECNKRFWFFLCVIDIYNKYAWVLPLKDKRSVTITNAFQKILDESNRNPNKLWVHKGSEFYKTLMKS